MEQRSCPLYTTLDLLSGKWTVRILVALGKGPKRYGDLRRQLGNVSQKVLSAQLHKLAQQGLLTRTVYPESPLRVEYALTELGESLRPILSDMNEWGKHYRQLEFIA